MLTKFEIQSRLKQAYAPGKFPESPYPKELLKDNPKPAAVLIPFIKIENDWNLIFIRRTKISHDRHSGQVAFPGGRCDPIDPNAQYAALREAQEEIGILPEDVEILGRVRDMLTISNYRVTPIVGVIPWPYSLMAQDDEVARIFKIPLRWLANPRNRQVQMRKLKSPKGEVPVIFFKEFDGELLWGASARITLLLLEALGLSAPENRYI
jgi:8-oxo-dGTP pyrophosphatase MutT (NUDIX family)